MGLRSREAETMANVKPDAFAIFKYARQFMFADECLRLEGRPDFAIRYMTPSIVMSAFASELFLKCLRALEAPTVPTGHDLSKLFKGLRPNIQNNVIKRWDEYMATISDKLDIVENHSGDKIPRDFVPALNKCKDAFTVMRYKYEKPDKGTFYIQELPNILYNVILEQRPEWEFMSGFTMTEKIDK